MEKNSIYLRFKRTGGAHNKPVTLLTLLKLFLISTLFFAFTNASYSQQKVSGTITDASSGDPLIGVSIAVEGTNQGTITDANGKYTFESINPNATLILSYVGYTIEKISVGGQSTVDVKMVPDMTKLEEIVVVGYGVQKKKLVTGSTIEVKGEDIIKKSTVSPMVALQSVATGVNITKKSGQPGDGFKVTIRGVGTVGNSQPLYVIDGIPSDNIDYLSPNDIQSIDVLKDAASAAIYGARAANGVVLVTTKKGIKSSKVSLTYDGYFGVQNVYKLLPVLDAKEYMMIQDEASVNSGGKPIDWSTQLAPGFYQKYLNGTWNGTNWLKEMINKNAPTQNHAFNLTGGNEVSVFSAGFSYTNQEGIFGYPVQSKYNRYSFRINSEHAVLRSKGLEILKVGENVSYTFTKNNGIATGNMWGNNIYSAIEQDPLLPMYADNPADKAYPYHSPIPWNSLASNPIASMIYGNGNNLTKSHSLSANVYAVLQPVKGLKYRTSFSVTPNYNSYRSFNPTYYLGANNHNDNNGVTQNMSGGYNYIFEQTLNYEFSLMKNHNFNILVGSSAEKRNLGEYLQVTNKNSVFNDFEHAYIRNANVNSTASIDGTPQNNGVSAILSYFGRINYDYKEKYMLSLIMRADGSSNFAPGKRWGTFPSVSAGWVVSNESFMESAKSILDFLKLRGSWGQNGNQSIPPFQYLSNITFNNPSNNVFANYYFGAAKITPSLGAFPYNLPEPQLKWETSQQTDLGLDARLLKSRFNLSFDYYVKTTKDWLVAVPVLGSWGVQVNPSINGGEIQNKGWEISFGWKDKIGKDFTYGISANVSFNHNEVTRIDNPQGVINADGVKLWGNGTYVSRAEVGHPIGYFYGYKTAGIFQNTTDVQNYKDSKGNVIMPNAVPGDVKFVDEDGDGSITDKDRVQIGDPNPHTIYSINLNCAYKGFDLSVTTYGVGGNQIAREFHDAGSFANNYTTEVLGRWHGEGTSNKIPRVTSGGNINLEYNSDLEIENGSYFRISNVTIGYDVKRLVKKLPMDQLRLFFTVQNLYTFTKYSGMDPEIGTSTDDNTWGWARGVDLGFYPNPRTIMFGASIKF